eukprot:SAG31_NODE_4059_length_3630_cov_2.094308_3_plen_287_part_00
MELSVAQYLTEIDASMLIIDCNWNMNHAMITENTIPLVHYLRANGHATTPIVLAEGTPSGTDWAAAEASATQQGANALALAAAFKSLVAAGDKHLYYATSEELFADSLGITVNPGTDDPTVGGCHLSDLGMRKQAAYWASAIPKFMAQSRRTLGAGAAQQARRPRQITATPLTLKETEAEHAASELAIAAVEASAGPDGWGEIGFVPSSPRTRSTIGGVSAAIDASIFARGRPFPDSKRNNSFDRFPLSYAPTCPCHGGQPCACVRLDGCSCVVYGPQLRNCSHDL